LTSLFSCPVHLEYSPTPPTICITSKKKFYSTFKPNWIALFRCLRLHFYTVSIFTWCSSYMRLTTPQEQGSKFISNL
jgi:hypothetical protein